MRYIDIKKLLLNRSKWGHGQELWKNENLRHDFRDYFYNKCWYTEVKLLGQDPQIDHFRPKGKIKQFENYNYNIPLSESGYNWLSNDPANYRLCCVYANRKTGDGGKGCFFPLSENSPLLTENGEDVEDPLLLDPCKQEDVNLISFVGNRTIATSMATAEQIRVEVSKKIYNLEDTYIMAERAKVWNGVEKILAEYKSGDITKTSCLRQLNGAVSRDAQFSACAIACVNSLAPDEIIEELNLEL